MEPVEHMAPQGVAFRQARMVEVCAGIVDHAELLHDTVRAQVLKNGKEDLSHWSVGATAATREFRRKLTGCPSSALIERRQSQAADAACQSGECTQGLSSKMAWAGWPRLSFAAQVLRALHQKPSARRAVSL
jgi:hypothetical protein